jgi:hypothetical protein
MLRTGAARSLRGTRQNRKLMLYRMQGALEAKDKRLDVVEIKRKALQELSALSTTTHSKCLFLREKVAEYAFIDRIHFCL